MKGIAFEFAFHLWVLEEKKKIRQPALALLLALLAASDGYKRCRGKFESVEETSERDGVAQSCRCNFLMSQDTAFISVGL